MKKNLFFLFCLFCFGHVYSQIQGIWEIVKCFPEITGLTTEELSDFQNECMGNIVFEEAPLKVQFLHGIDSIVIEYWDSQYAHKYIICIFDNTENTLLREYFSGENITIDSLDLIKSFISYINDFYIDKTKRIILNKIKTNIIVSGDWPSIKIIGYRNGIEIFDEYTWITEEYGLYHIVFNSEFIEFYELIKSFVRYIDEDLKHKFDMKKSEN